MVASKIDLGEEVEKLMGKGTRMDLQDTENGWTELMLACAYCHERVVEKLLGKGASVDVQDKSGRCRR